jgi:hypothetical protein
MSKPRKPGPTAAKTFQHLELDPPLPTVIISGWARVGTGKFHHYDNDVSGCNYQRKAGVLVVADGTPDKANCCSACLLHLNKAGKRARQQQPDERPAQGWFDESTSIDSDLARYLGDERKQASGLHFIATASDGPVINPRIAQDQEELEVVELRGISYGKIESYRRQERQAILDSNPT